MRAAAWLLAGALACTADRDDPSSAWPPTTVDPGSDSMADDGASETSSGTDATTDAAFDTSSTGAPVEFDPSFVYAQAEAALAEGVPGLAVAVVMDGELVLAEGFGVADANGTPVDETTLFNMASVTKPLTALTVLTLRDEGVLDLETPVPTIAPQFGVAAGFDPASVHVRHLLTHTSALGDWPTEPFAYAGTLADSFALNHNQPLWAAPGAVWNYSNRGFELAGLVAAEASGQPFAEAVHDRVLVPLAMTTATLDAEVANGRTHAKGESAGAWLGPLDHGGETYEPSAGLWAGASDLGAFARALATGEADGIAAATFAEMLSPIQPTREWPGAHYGYGMFVDVGFDPVVASHAGSTGGFLSDLEVVPSEAFAVVVVVNTDAWFPGAMSWAIVEHYLGTPAGVATDEPLDPSSFPGSYEEPWHLGKLEVIEGGSGLELEFVDLAATVPLEPLWGASYACTHPTEGYEMGFVFWADENGQARYLVGRDGVAPKID
jgi:CubicO group peptidase (beta-lactamase class C family)